MAHDKANTGRPGFTLVEMLTVLLILAIILALVVGISKHLMEEAARKQTEATQSVLMNGIIRYKELTRNLPTNTASNGEYVLDQLIEGAPNEVQQIAARVPKDAFVKEPMTSGSSELHWYSKDGWGQRMKYYPTGGRGGVPVLLSGGPDRKVNGTPTHADNLDNIRSDGH